MVPKYFQLLKEYLNYEAEFNFEFQVEFGFEFEVDVEVKCAFEFKWVVEGDVELDF